MVRVAGIVVPESDGCLGNEAVEAIDLLVGGRTQLEIADQGVDSAGTQLVSIDDLASRGLAAEMVARGVAVADAHEGDLTPAMAEARQEAMRLHRGFFDEREECTYAAVHAGAIQALKEALDQPTPVHSADAAHAITGLVAAIAVAKSANGFAREAHRDLRLLAYPKARLTTMKAKLRKRRGAARASLREMRDLRSNLELVERQERIRQAELERIRREQAQLADAEQQYDEPSRSDDSGEAYPGYTGPRCYEPGGKVWHPC